MCQLGPSRCFGLQLPAFLAALGTIPSCLSFHSLLMALWSLLLATWTCSVAASSLDFPRHRARPSSGRGGCHPLPGGLTLCQGVDYGRMRLPNLLGHETPKEVVQQAGAWDVEEPIVPCRALCRGVQEGCAPVMAAFGFPWPEMLNCSRFPSGDEGLCVPPLRPQATTPALGEEADGVCTACLSREKDLLESLCSQDFGEFMYICLRGHSVIFKGPGWTQEGLQGPFALEMPDKGPCSCPELAAGDVVLGAGHRVDGRTVLSWVRRWPKGDKDMRKLSRAIKRLRC
uniref:FZ domain-containing protein n=1 Tax=Anolis carolinensis TaxID=28377 RepID=A0A803U0D1_ANOCA